MLKSTRELTSAKGLLFVHLYGAYEYTVTAGLRETYRQINAAKIEFRECHSLLLTVALDPEISSFVQVGSAHAWKGRRSLFSKVNSNEIISINEAVNPAAGKNLAKAQLESIWESLRIRGPMLPRLALIGRINELVQNRVDIAHGNASPSEVGRRYSVDELRNVHKDIEEVCVHILSTLEDYIKNQHFRA